MTCFMCGRDKDGGREILHHYYCPSCCEQAAANVRALYDMVTTQNPRFDQWLEREFKRRGLDTRDDDA